MDRVFGDSLSRNVAFKCLMFMPEISNRMVLVNGKHPRSQQVLLNSKKKIGGSHAFFKDN